MGTNLHEWLYQEAVEGRLDQEMVFKFLEREEREGTQCVTLKIHSGKNHYKNGIQTKDDPMFPPLTVRASNFMVYHTILKTSKDYFRTHR